MLRGRRQACDSQGYPRTAFRGQPEELGAPAPDKVKAMVKARVKRQSIDNLAIMAVTPSKPASTGLHRPLNGRGGLWCSSTLPLVAQSSRRRLQSDDLFKVALGAALAATNLTIIEGS